MTSSQGMPVSTSNDVVNGCPETADNIGHGDPLPPPPRENRQARAAPPLPSTTARYPATSSNYAADHWCVMLVCVVIFLIVVLLCDLLYLIMLNSAYDQYNNPKFQVESLSVSSFNLSADSRLTATWDVGISARNGNRETSLTYHNFEVSILHYTQWRPENLSTQFLSKGEVAPFHQPNNSTTSTFAKLSVYMQNIEDLTAMAIADERGFDGAIYLDVFILAKIEFNHHLYGSETRLIRAVCKPVKVGFSPNTTEGRMMGPPNSCSILSRFHEIMMRIMDS